MTRKDFHRAENELHAIEQELLQRLHRALTEVAAGHNSLFLVTTDYNPSDLPAHMLPTESAELLELARQSIQLRKLLAMSTDRCVGALFIASCEEHANVGDPHRLGAKRLAARLLSHLGSKSN